VGSLAAGTRIADRFVVTELAATGGMGAVYRGRDESTGDEVAIKVLLSPGRLPRERLRVEASVLARLDHPACVPLLHADVESEQPVLVMPWVDGEVLADRLKRGPLPVEETISLASQLADGLAHAHKLGITHRDVKPANLLWGAGRLRIVDFGIARSDASLRDLTRTGVIVGTTGYLAPEQVRGQPPTPRVDVFAFGAVLYECLTGERAFGGGAELAVLARILVDPVPPPSATTAGVPRWLDELVDKLLSKDADDRPADGAAVQHLLRTRPERDLYALADDDEAESTASGEQRLISVAVAGASFEVPQDAPTIADQWQDRLDPSVFKGLDVEKTQSGMVVATRRGGATARSSPRRCCSTHGRSCPASRSCSRPVARAWAITCPSAP
jgi:serine/threonine protein kinase